MDHTTLRNNLIKLLWFYEYSVILICIGAGVFLAVDNGGTIIMAAPLLLIAAAESLRIPLAAWSMHLRTAGRSLAYLVLLCIAIGSFEGLSLAFEQFINNRVVRVMAAEVKVDDIQAVIDARGKSIDALKEELSVAQSIKAEADLKVKSQTESKNELIHSSNRNCDYGSRLNRYHGACQDDITNSKINRSNAENTRNRAQRLDQEADGARKKVENISRELKSRTLEDIIPVTNDLRKAKQILTSELRLSPMHRLAASVYGIKVTDLTDDQFETVKKYAVFGLAGAFSTLSMLVSIVAHTKPNDGTQSKITRSLRALLARLRKPIVRTQIVEVIKEIINEVEVIKPVEKIVEKYIEKYVPYDFATMRRINPDFTHGDKVELRSVQGGRN